VATTHTTKLTRPKADPHLQAAGERVKAAAEELERLGIADADGKRVHSDLPTDMRDGVDRDFGADKWLLGCSSSPAPLAAASRQLSLCLGLALISSCR
jgi:hypothetical protein